jgi:sulfur dioxygenase
LLPREDAMFLRQLFDSSSSTYSYLLADERTREAILVDSVFEQHVRDSALVRELSLKLLYALDTHCHADHVTGAWLMRAEHGCKIGLGAAYGASNVDLPLRHGDVVRFGDQALEVRATPGHTEGCLSFVSADHTRVFTGDALLVRGAGRTDFQRGDAARLFHSIRDQLFTLPDSCEVYPAHDYEGRTSSTIGEERRHNPRVGGDAREVDFVGYMQNLALPHPKQLALALPANLRSGEPEGGHRSPEPSWGPVVTNYAGVPEVAPEWVAQHRRELVLLDVRGSAELEGELGKLNDMLHIPLERLREQLEVIPTRKPVVVICQTGKRSSLGTQILVKGGAPRVANVAGGMARWRELGLPDT